MAKQTKVRTTPRKKLEMLLTEHATVSPEELYATGAFAGRNSVYEACGNGTIETIRLGRRFLIPTAPLRKRLGIEAA